MRVLCIQLGLIGLTNLVVCDPSSGAVVKFVILSLSVVEKPDETSLLVWTPGLFKVFKFLSESPVIVRHMKN